MATVENDIKRILAFSTVSQLGFMMAACGAGAPSAAYFHLVTHAFFKALLFLVAGALIHAVHTNDIFKMGRLAHAMPITGACFAAGALALSGVFPTAGFFSKDAILAAVYESGHPVGFAILVATAGLTAFYIGRAFFVAMMGPTSASGHTHDPRAAMRIPLLVLAVLAIVAGFAAPKEHVPIVVPLSGTAAAGLGLAIAWAGYQRRSFDPGGVRRSLAPLVAVLERRWYIDDVFEGVYRFAYLKIAAGVGWVDRYVVDGVVNAVTWATWIGAGRLTALQNGRVQDALYATAAGLVLLVWLSWLR
jgi:NADH:ubiquinone oxidoreductase subunit 5 (subunit L)/multisubunit Na+/H+ antiporter MnhA subunit